MILLLLLLGPCFFFLSFSFPPGDLPTFLVLVLTFFFLHSGIYVLVYVWRKIDLTPSSLLWSFYYVIFWLSLLSSLCFPRGPIPLDSLPQWYAFRYLVQGLFLVWLLFLPGMFNFLPSSPPADNFYRFLSTWYHNPLNLLSYRLGNYLGESRQRQGVYKITLALIFQGFLAIQTIVFLLCIFLWQDLSPLLFLVPFLGLVQVLGFAQRYFVAYVNENLIYLLTLVQVTTRELDREPQISPSSGLAYTQASNLLFFLQPRARALGYAWQDLMILRDIWFLVNEAQTMILEMERSSFLFYLTRGLILLRILALLSQAESMFFPYPLDYEDMYKEIPKPCEPHS